MSDSCYKVSDGNLFENTLRVFVYFIRYVMTWKFFNRVTKIKKVLCFSRNFFIIILSCMLRIELWKEKSEYKGKVSMSSGHSKVFLRIFRVYITDYIRI